MLWTSLTAAPAHCWPLLLTDWPKQNRPFSSWEGERLKETDGRKASTVRFQNRSPSLLSSLVTLGGGVSRQKRDIL